MKSRYSYWVGGSLAKDDPTYIERQADIDLHYALQVGHFCYVLGAPQIGKSSLQVRTRSRLEERDYQCATLEMPKLTDCTYQSAQAWYAALIWSIWHELKPIDSTLFLQWFETTTNLSPRLRLDSFVEQVLLNQLAHSPVVIFLDAVEALLPLPFSTADLFEWIGHCYHQREKDPTYRHLNFAVFGNATPTDLSHGTHLFASGCSIVLDPFQLVDTRQLRLGLQDKIEDTATVLQAVLRWTSGQPLLTQKLCHIVLKLVEILVEPSQSPLSLTPNVIDSWLDRVVQSHIIQNWCEQDQPSHLQTIEAKLVTHPSCLLLLTLYRQILNGESITFEGSPCQLELLLTGIIVVQDQQLQIANKIYRQVFDLGWVQRKISQCSEKSLQYYKPHQS